MNLTQKLYLNDKPIEDNTKEELVDGILELFQELEYLKKNNQQLQMIMRQQMMKAQGKEKLNAGEDNGEGNKETEKSDKGDGA